LKLGEYTLLEDVIVACSETAGSSARMLIQGKRKDEKPRIQVVGDTIKIDNIDNDMQYYH
jgi:hypothetical protein